MRDYIFELLEIAKEEKCLKCIRMQQELRRVSRIIDDSQIKGKIGISLLDHDLHYPLGCKPCSTNERIREFTKPKP